MKSRTPQLDMALAHFRHSVAPGVPDHWRHLWSVAMWHNLLLAAAYGELKHDAGVLGTFNEQGEKR
jgi:hypothetical protein